MKKLALLMMIACLVCVTAAAAEEPLPVFDDLTGIGAFLSKIGEDNPIESVYFTHGYGFSDSEFSTANPDRISRVITALKNLEVTGVTQMDVTDWYPYLGLHAADGTVLSIGFNGEWLEHGGTHYELSGIKQFYKEMNMLIKETTDDRRTIFLNGVPVDILTITLQDFFDAGFEAAFYMDEKEAYITHPDYNGGMIAGITDEDPKSLLTFVSMAFADELPVSWSGGNPHSGLDYWEKELNGFIFDAPQNMEGCDSELGWKCAEFYFGSGEWLRFMSKGDAPELYIIRK